MLPNPYQIRLRIRRAVCHLGRQKATVYRPDRDDFGGLLDTSTELGTVAGYPYEKVHQAANIVIALPGQLDEGDHAGKYLMVLYGVGAGRDLGDYDYEPPDTQKDDVLEMGGVRYRVLSVRDAMGVYKLYQYKEM